MIIPPIDELRKIYRMSILNQPFTYKNLKKLEKNGIGTGRYSHGLHVEDFAYLIVVYDNLNKDGSSLRLSSLSLTQSFMLQQMIGIPCKRIYRDINTPRVADKLSKALNSAQNDWYFDFSIYNDLIDGSMLRYLVRNVTIIGGNELGLGGLFDL